MENGGTVVIGGIFDQNDQTDISRIPVLGELPYIGWLFKNQTTTTRARRTSGVHHAKDRQRTADRSLKIAVACSAGGRRGGVLEGRAGARPFFSRALLAVTMRTMGDSRGIFLVGLMGAGKTTIGRLLARRLKRAFVDADHEIEGRCGVRIPVIFDIEGEAGFRAREAAVIDEVTGRDGIVLATGGGAVLDAANRRHLAARGTVIYLHSTPANLWERTRHDKNRPLLATADPEAAPRRALSPARPALPGSRRSGR